MSCWCTWCKNNWVHHWFCANVSEAAHDCGKSSSSPSSLQLAHKLEAWADDQSVAAMPDRFRGGICGPRPTDGHYESDRDFHRAEAKDQAKKIRQAVEWLQVPLDRKDKEYRYATTGRLVMPRHWCSVS